MQQLKERAECAGVFLEPGFFYGLAQCGGTEEQWGLRVFAAQGKGAYFGNSGCAGKECRMEGGLHVQEGDGRVCTSLGAVPRKRLGGCCVWVFGGIPCELSPTQGRKHCQSHQHVCESEAKGRIGGLAKEEWLLFWLAEHALVHFRWNY